MNYHWLIDATSLEFLDLSACEFHEKPNTALISALDLCVTPRRYSYLPFIQDREHLIEHWRVMDALRENVSSSRKTDTALSSPIKLIEVLILSEQADPVLDALTTCFFSDYSRNVMERLSAYWETETIRVYLEHVKMYFHSTEKSLFAFPAFFDHDPNIITFEKPCITCNRREKSLFMKAAMKKIATELIKMMQDKDCTDSLLVAEVFDALCFSWMSEFFFRYEARRMDYIFHHLKKANYFYFTHIVDILQKDGQYNVLLRSSPDHLLVLLKYGIEIKYSPILRPYRFYQFHSTEQLELNWGRIPAFLRRRWINLRPREAVIVEIFTNLYGWSVSHFAVYLNSLCLIWRSVPDTFLSYEEMKSFLLRHVDTKAVEQICNELQNREYHSFNMIHQPRTLSHYSRCVLRDTLMCNSQLPEGIEQLPLPKRLQSYLRLEF
ncbi:uncharacterized protein LOC118192759 [Stegodyphus dumicola]|uniref:uncharacterized protein LOC118192759 n=1 Tax=Stegodyphus dumicola TaxID=202533 RepID=UPI0015A948D2|nr:uncharacterized protein LOC118192759 [Stegodyphus dumicola]